MNLGKLHKIDSDFYIFTPLLTPDMIIADPSLPLDHKFKGNAKNIPKIQLIITYD